MSRAAGLQQRVVGGYREYVARVIYARVFSERGWPEWAGGILLGLANILFMVLAAKPFTIYTGFLNWGQHIYGLLGLDWLVGAPKTTPLENPTSLGDIGLLLGAFAAAVAAREFRLKRLEARDYLDAVLGGLLMSLGVVLAFGCNWGGFFSAISALSLHGYAMFIGLVAGGYLGLRYVEWKTARAFERLAAEELELEAVPESETVPARGAGAKLRQVLAVVLPVLAVYAVWAASGPEYAAMLGVGFLVGFVLQRARFCFATAFRDVLGGAEQARAIRLQTGIALGLVVGATGIAALKYMGLVEPYAYVKPVTLLNVVGGVLFGFGMAIAGGCASGSLWKAAEGNTGLLVALVTAVLSYPVLVQLRGPILQAVPHAKVFLPDLLGWLGALALIYATALAWILVTHYLAYRRGVDPWGG